ncbi:transposase [candidate division KSB1 bacterium]|nr:transposase [candidate division KSB1 bacterium]NIR70601.1 transposase [candidate division KSB1 bacterium]NIS24546.1 transposase [candidate division KSB1 bacterium]NIT71464.1 transposase [candidate division KSB1 bacterium]NIU25155.1 transposase [candidate division KSB1 bacterium]
MEKSQIFFITKVILNRVPDFALEDKYPLVVIDNFKFYRKKFGFALYGFIIMPDHYHLVVNTLGKVNG